MRELSDNPIKIRRAKAVDLPSLVELGSELMRSDRRLDPLFKEDWYRTEPGKKYLLKKIRGGQHVCFVAEAGDQLIGYATCSINKTETWRPVTHSELGNLYVRELTGGTGSAIIYLLPCGSGARAKECKRSSYMLRAAIVTVFPFMRRVVLKPNSLLWKPNSKRQKFVMLKRA